MSQANTEKVLDGLIETIVEAVASGDQVKIMDFGTFESKERAPKLGRNPKTNVEVMIEARRVPVFRAGKKFKEIVKL